jgi:hypothetical protein
VRLGGGRQLEPSTINSEFRIPGRTISPNLESNRESEDHSRLPICNFESQISDPAVGGFGSKKRNFVERDSGLQRLIVRIWFALSQTPPHADSRISGHPVVIAR